MYAASREALVATTAAMEAALAAAPAGSRTAVAAQVGADLFSIVDTIDVQRTLRVAIADASTDPDARAKLARQIFSGKVSEPAILTLTAAAEQQWSKPSDLLAGLVDLGRQALLDAAADQNQLDTVEDELFRLGRIIAANPEVETLLADRQASGSHKRALLTSLLYGKVTAVTEALAVQAVGRLRATPAADAVDALSDLAARRKDATVARVTSATALTDAQRDRLADLLAKLYRKQIAVHVAVDPSIMGGLTIRVGDEVIDGSATGRLAALRKTLG